MLSLLSPWTILSIGGSLVAPPEGIDTSFLQILRRLLVAEMEQGKKFAVIVGGGSTCRAYQKAAGSVRKLSHEEADWIGIYATRLNARLLHAVFGDWAHPSIFESPHDIPRKSPYAFFVGSGWKPGWSTDYVAVCAARRLGAKKVLNLSNIDYVYTADPRKDPKARALPQMTWKEYRALIGNAWTPGMNAPFDPVASRLAAKEKMEVVILNGKNIPNLRACLAQKKCVGTRIVD